MAYLTASWTASACLTLAGSNGAGQAVQRLVSRAQRSTSWWCAADPGPSFLLKKSGSRISGSPLSRCTASGTRVERPGPNSKHLEHLDPHRPLLPRAIADGEDAVEPARRRVGGREPHEGG